MKVGDRVMARMMKNYKDKWIVVMREGVVDYDYNLTFSKESGLNSLYKVKFDDGDGEILWKDQLERI